jgi:hypothetical protein
MKNIDLADPSIDPVELFESYRSWMRENYHQKWITNTYLIYLWFSEKMKCDLKSPVEENQWQSVRRLCAAWVKIGLIHRETDSSKYLEYYRFEMELR